MLILRTHHPANALDPEREIVMPRKRTEAKDGHSDLTTLVCNPRNSSSDSLYLEKVLLCLKTYVGGSNIYDG
jgi:hypothetical protein